MKNIEYIGTIINDLKIINYYCTKEPRRRCYFECLCTCGKVFTSRAESIKNGTTKSCGCKRYELSAIAHTLDNELVMSKRVYNNYKHTAIRKNVLFSLSIDEFKQLIFKNCFYCGIAPQLSKWAGSIKWKTKDKFFIYNGIDKIDNNVG